MLVMFNRSGTARFIILLEFTSNYKNNLIAPYKQ